MGDLPTKRLFVAIPLDDDTIGDLSRFMRRVDAPNLRATAPANLHVTLKFLGDVEDPAIPGVLDALEHAVADAGCSPFDLTSTALALLPDERRPRVFALETDLPDPLVQLVEALEERLAEAGFPREGRRFRSHITLGRFRGGMRGGGRRRGRREDGPRPPAGFIDGLRTPDVVIAVDRVLLCQSTLDRAGPTYTPMATFPLG